MCNYHPKIFLYYLVLISVSEPTILDSELIVDGKILFSSFIILKRKKNKITQYIVCKKNYGKKIRGSCHGNNGTI